MKYKPFILGVSGLAGSGKSTLCRYLAERHGFVWIEVDALVRGSYRKGMQGYEKIREFFGADFVNSREVDRAVLRGHVLKNPHQLWILNQITHPIIEREVSKKIEQSRKTRSGLGFINKEKIVIESFYFSEDLLGKFIDQLILVDTPIDVCTKRLEKRELDFDEIDTLLTIQSKALPKGRFHLPGTTHEVLFAAADSLYATIVPYAYR